MKFINIGFGNIINAQRIISVLSPESAPLKRMIVEKREEKKLIDATYGRKTRSVIIMDTSQIVLSSVQPDTIFSRLNNI